MCIFSDLSSVEIEVESELPIGAGLGSSAGFSVCLSTALLMTAGIVSRPTEDNVWKDQDLYLINKWAFICETLTHGKPSGIDNSIATYGEFNCDFSIKTRLHIQVILLQLFTHKLNNFKALDF